MPVLDPADTFLHVASHACLAGGWRLGWALDVAAVAGSGRVDWAAVSGRGHSSGLGLPGRVMLERTRRLLDPGLGKGHATRNSAWLEAIALLDRIRPPIRVRRAPISGKAVVSATCPTTATSFARLAAVAAGSLRPQPGDDPAELHQPAGGSEDRRAFLRAVAAEEAATLAAAR